MEDKIYNLKIETVSPVHVGAGQEKDWIQGVDFICSQKKVYVLSLKKLVNYISPDELAQINLQKNSSKILDRVNDLSEIVIENGIFELNGMPSDEIKTHIKSGIPYHPIIPGSSVKGSIRSVLFNYLKPSNENDIRKVFGQSHKGTDFMRFINVSDASFKDTVLMQTKIHNLHEEFGGLAGGWKHKRKNETNEDFHVEGFHTTYEVIPPIENSSISLTIKSSSFKKVHGQTFVDKKERILNGGDISGLFSIINENTHNYIAKEINYFKKYEHAAHTEDIIDFYEYLETQIPESSKGCLIRLGAGSGFHSITGDWMFPDNHMIDFIAVNKGRSRGQYQRKNSAKSRKIAIETYDDTTEFMPMGFVQLTLM